jgi:hypothetical protein
VGDAAFASPEVGWAYAGDLESAQCRVLFTDDAGATWRPQLAWRGMFHGRLAVFGERAAGFGLAVSQGDDINGYRPDPRRARDPALGLLGPDMFLASTVDAGATWTLAPEGGAYYFLTPRQAWLARNGLIRTRDGGASWQLAPGMPGVHMISVRFQSEAEGLLVAASVRDFGHQDLYQTVNGGVSWERVPLTAPPGLPAKADTSLDPVTRPDGGVLLVLSAESGSESERRSRWEGTYAYRPDGQGGWAGPYRLPMAVARLHPPHVVVPGPDGRIWAAAGHDLFVADDLAGPWRHQAAPLPDGQVITRLEPVAGSMFWATTRRFPALAAVSGGQLYRSADDGAHWNRVTVDAT